MSIVDRLQIDGNTAKECELEIVLQLYKYGEPN